MADLPQRDDADIEKPDEPEDSESTEQADEKDLEDARARFKEAAEAETDIRRDGLDDLEFRAGKQWNDKIRMQREIDDRPCIVINRMPQFIRQITNDQRQNRPSIKVHPVDDKADIETARVLQGLMRHIEYNSGADTAYDTAFDSAVTVGRGFFRIVTDYCDPKSFDQEILIKRIPNPFMVYMDPAAREPDGSDANYAFIVEDLTKREFAAQYPDEDTKSLEEFSSIGDNGPWWMPDGKVRVAEYFYKEFRDADLALLSSGETVEEEGGADQRAKHEAELNSKHKITIVKRRKAKIPTVKWLKMNGVKVLERRELVFDTWIPIIPVIGEELDVNGKLILAGIVRNAKDSQRMYNYMVSAETETIALAPRVPFIGAEGQFAGHEQQWMVANRKNLAFLQYKPLSLNGTPVAPPSRQAFEAPIQAITMARSQAADDLKATTGIYDSALGAKSNEQSGIAIQRRNTQSQTSNFHFIDNLTRSLRHAGRIIIAAIPKVYDSARSVRIIGDDTEQSVVLVNQELPQGSAQKQPFNLVDAGKYDVIVETGPSFATKRAEAAAMMIDLTKSIPQIAQLAPDVIVKNTDIPGASDIAERLRRGLPPGIADDPNNKQPLPPQAVAQMKQMGQMIDGLTKANNALHNERDNNLLQLQSKERIEQLKCKVALELGLAEINQRDGIAVLESEIARIQQQSDHFQDAAHADAGNDAAAAAAQNSPAAPPGAAPNEQQPTGGQAPGSPVENP